MSLSNIVHSLGKFLEKESNHWKRFQVQIVFDHFKIRADNINTNSSLGNWKAYGRAQCHDDWIEIFNIHMDQSKQLLGR